MALTFCSLCLDSGVIPPGSSPLPYFVAVQSGLTSALCVCLLINGFVGFQLYEDGTKLSVWLLRTVSFAFFIISGLVSLATFKDWAGLGPTHTVGLFVVLYIVSGLCLLVYVIMQVILVTRTLEDRWPLGDIAFGVFFFTIGQVILYAFSDQICNAVQHYLDGLFFATTCNLLAVMMIYKVSHHIDFSPDTSILTSAVLGFNYQGRPRILRWNKAEQLGSEGAPTRR
jgi:Chitin synthase export chaperone